MLEDQTTPLVDVQSLARTYNPQSYPDPANLLEDYDRVMEYASKHPDHGRTRVGTALELPPSRVRTWIEGGKPDAVHAVETARELGWLDATLQDAIGDACAVLAAGIYTCGSIDNDRIVPAWNPSTRIARQLIIHGLEVVGTGYSLRHAGESDRPTEIIPATNASVFGRVLVCLGIPQGDFTMVKSLPNWFDQLSTGTRRTLALLWVCERATAQDDKDTLMIQGRYRGEFYRRTVADLIREIVDGAVTATEQNVVISAAAARTLPSVFR
ncbi:hypothetical protein [Halobaculum rubrum]|uniref:hypothetical protein n=1 Tax=Halobaculum rubrum TaxID=2872158 RepID=UPI001CA44A66|nr:hypothetical protein [Halobaculum rubrum]QZX99790.1 hypothetical protein K6T25_01385 [Halobaculum rubrum]QZX99827.1 hypothetical protein K6T25_01580 [Halobaculum rubrum]